MRELFHQWMRDLRSRRQRPRLLHAYDRHGGRHRLHTSGLSDVRFGIVHNAALRCGVADEGEAYALPCNGRGVYLMMALPEPRHRAFNLALYRQWIVMARGCRPDLP